MIFWQVVYLVTAWYCFGLFCVRSIRFLFLTAGCKWIGIGLPFCWINFAPAFNCMSNFDVSVNSLLNLRCSVLFRSIVLSGLFMRLTFVLDLFDSRVIPSFSIQSSPSSWCAFLVVASSSSCCFYRPVRRLLLFYLQILFCYHSRPGNILLLIGLLYYCISISGWGSILNLIGLLLNNSVAV